MIGGEETTILMGCHGSYSYILLFVKSFEFVAILGHEAMLRLAPNVLIKKGKERENAKGRRKHWEWDQGGRK